MKAKLAVANPLAETTARTAMKMKAATILGACTRGRACATYYDACSKRRRACGVVRT